jgi:hypothetical protein
MRRRDIPLYELAELHGTGKMQPFDERFAQPVVLALIAYSG